MSSWKLKQELFIKFLSKTFNRCCVTLCRVCIFYMFIVVFIFSCELFTFFLIFAPQEKILMTAAKKKCLLIEGC